MSRQYTYTRYLEAKCGIDDRSLCRPVLQTLQHKLAMHPRKNDLRVLDLGGGTGSMIRRSLDWSLLAQGHYTLIDESSKAIAGIPQVLSKWSETREQPTEINAQPLSICSAEEDVQVHTVVAELSEFLSSCDQTYDLIIANAVLDLVDVATVLPLLWQRCDPNTLFWFTINFDGESAFLPARAEDADIFEAYHASMDRRPGSRAAGRGLFSELQKQGAHIHAAGSSDWVVFASDKTYSGDEAYFLHHIVHTIDAELTGHPDVEKLDFQGWIERRHQDIDSGQLVYIAHQLDFAGRVPNPLKGA